MEEAIVAAGDEFNGYVEKYEKIERALNSGVDKMGGW